MCQSHPPPSCQMAPTSKWLKGERERGREPGQIFMCPYEFHKLALMWTLVLFKRRSKCFEDISLSSPTLICNTVWFPLHWKSTGIHNLWKLIPNWKRELNKKKSAADVKLNGALQSKTVQKIEDTKMFQDITQHLYLIMSLIIWKIFSPREDFENFWSKVRLVFPLGFQYEAHRMAANLSFSPPRFSLSFSQSLWRAMSPSCRNVETTRQWFVTLEATRKGGRHRDRKRETDLMSKSYRELPNLGGRVLN